MVKMSRLRYYTIWPLARWFMRRPRLWQYARWAFLYVDKWGFSWSRKGSDVLWLWPWQRQFNGWKRYYDVNCGGGFKTLADVDAFWEEYRVACQTRVEQEGLATL